MGINMAKPKNTSIILYPSDKNGCGFYRTLIPFRYLASKDKDFQISEFFAYNFDLNYLRNADWMRFQRQVTAAQTKIIRNLKAQIEKNNFKTKMAYELDDLVHGIEINNILAYQFYTKSRKDNLIDIFKMADLVTFSTQYLKDYYKDKFGIDNAKVVPNFLPRYLWWPCGQRDKYNKGKKLRILWAGSASHIGKGGDLEFLIPLVKKTLNEFEWVFFGVCPPELDKKVEFHSWCDMHEYPQKIDSIDADIAIAPIKDVEFNYAKSDLKILEYSALGLPTIASTIGNKQGPYDTIPGLNLVSNNIDNWYQAIKEFENNFDKRVECLDYGKEHLESRWLEDNIDIYRNLYKIKT
jgi:glycosyltransferase involved in cell wall biosynthesis